MQVLEGLLSLSCWGSKKYFNQSRVNYFCGAVITMPKHNNIIVLSIVLINTLTVRCVVPSQFYYTLAVKVLKYTWATIQLENWGVVFPGLKTEGVVCPGLKTGGVVCPGLKTGVVMALVGPKNSTDGGT